jgi:hypothetical protein
VSVRGASLIAHSRGLDRRPSAARAGLDAGPFTAGRADRRLASMPRPTPPDLGELALTATLLSVYLGARGTARALGAVQSLIG